MGMTWYVKILRRITWSTPLVDELGDLVDELSASGRRRKCELTKLRNLSPAVLGTPKPMDPLGDAIGQVIQWQLAKELSDRRLVFNLNFVLARNTATGMIYIYLARPRG
jgi:hypothetical protein